MIAVLTLLGLVMVLSASSVTALHVEGSSWTYFRKQALWTVLGAAALVITTRVPYHHWRRFVPTLLLVSFSLMVVVLIPSIGNEVNGARAWFSFGPIGFQPSELMKLALLLYTADLLARRADRMHEVRDRRCCRASWSWPAPSAWSCSSPTSAGRWCSRPSCSAWPSSPARRCSRSAPRWRLVGTAGAAFMLQVRGERWTAFLDLAAHRQDDGFQVWQSLVGIASGGLTGVGLGAGKAKWGFLPEAHTDFIFAVIAEELGLAGVAIVGALFLVLVLLGIRVALRAPDRFGMLLAGGITCWILAQTVINIGGVVGLMPLTGLTLPFVSFGGSSLLVTMAAAGLLLNVARSGR